MYPVLRIWLAFASGLLAWNLFRADAPVRLWLYFLFAAYSAVAFQPSDSDWWSHVWLWVEPIRMTIRTFVTVALLREIRYCRPTISWISTLIAFAFCITYRVTFGPTGLMQFMAIRTYWLLSLWVFLLSTLLCLWRIGEPRPMRLTLWYLVMLCYAASSIIDWRISTSEDWAINTNAWSLVLAVVVSVWAVKEHLNQKHHGKH